MKFAKGQSFKLVILMFVFGVGLVIADMVTQVIGRPMEMTAIYTFVASALIGGLANYFGRSYVEHKNHRDDDNRGCNSNNPDF
ncbi:MAG: hypothetical protein KDK38_09645 [Leptospiraceae bacterium]|nr:hypothetical protein [Leptospiraceae bacterium]